MENAWPYEEQIWAKGHPYFKTQLKHDLNTKNKEAEKIPAVKIQFNRQINIHAGREINTEEVLISLNRIPTSSDKH